MMSSLAQDDDRFYPKVDKYWFARGGSYTDGGAFIFTVDQSNGDLVCTDKFGQQVTSGSRLHTYTKSKPPINQESNSSEVDSILSYGNKRHGLVLYSLSATW